MKKLLLTALLGFGLLLSGCAPASTPAAPQATPTSAQSQEPQVLKTIAEAESLAGFDVKEPTYLPTGVTLDFATYQAAPYPTVTLHYKLVHPTLGDRGAFFRIVQEPQAAAMPNPAACGAAGDECETVPMGGLTVKYRLTTPTESLMWEADGFIFSLLRTAGEPNKIYKDELLQVASSMQ